MYLKIVKPVFPYVSKFLYLDRGLNNRVRPSFPFGSYAGLITVGQVQSYGRLYLDLLTTQFVGDGPKEGLEPQT